MLPATGQVGLHIAAACGCCWWYWVLDCCTCSLLAAPAVVRQRTLGVLIELRQQRLPLDDDMFYKTVVCCTDINVKQSQDGVTPLHLACRYSSSDVTQFLLFRQAVVNVTDAKGRTPLHYATRHGNDLITKVWTRRENTFISTFVVVIVILFLIPILSLSQK